MRKQALKYLVYISILLITTIIAISIILKDNFSETIKVIRKADLKLIFLMLLLMLSIYIIEGLVLTFFVRLNNKKYRWKQGTYNGLIGVFFNGITPSASGGQFVQAYTFSKQGVPISRSASVLLMNFITYQIAMIIFCLLTLIFNYRAAYNSVQWNGLNVIHLSLIGFGINVIVIGTLYFVAYSKLFHKLIVVHLINLLAKLKIIRKKEKFREKVDLQIKNFKIEATELHKNYKVWITVLLLHLAKFAILYSIPFFAIRAVGYQISSSDFFLVIAFTSFVYLITSFIPLPGASGGAELFFATFFAAFFASSTEESSILSAALIIWRLVTFYFGLILGALVFFFYRESGKTELQKVDDPIKYYETAKLEKVIMKDSNPQVIFKENDDINPDDKE